MSIASYSDLMVQVHRLLYGDDIQASDLPVATLVQVIALAEKRIYREVRSRFNEKSFSGVTVTSNLAAIPTDFEACSVIHFGKKALLPTSEEWLREYLQSYPSGETIYFAEAGTSFYFGPAVADATAVQGRYFYRFADLTSSTFSSNTLIAADPDLFIYATLVEAAPYFSKDPTLWEAKYQGIRDKLNADKSRAAFSAGRIQVRPSTKLMG